MVEDDNRTPSIDDIMRAAQDDPEVARNLAAALAEIAPKRAAAAAAEVAPAQAAAALAEIAPERSAAGPPGVQRSLALLRLEKYATDDVHKAVVAQLNLLDTYYNTALGQAKQSFNSALISAAVGLAFFLVAVAVLLVQPFILPGQPLDTIALLSVLSGAIVEVVAGINFYLFNKTQKQVSNFHGTLLETQRFLLANSVCDSLDNLTDQTRAELIGAMAKFQAVPPKVG